MSVFQVKAQTATLIPDKLTITPIPSLCTQCLALPEAKSKGDADCSQETNINDVSIWRSEFIAGEFGEVSKNDWRADFDCNGKVNLNDISIWRSNFISSLLK